MSRAVGTTGSTVWMTDDENDPPVVVYPEGAPDRVRLLTTVVTMSNGAFRPVTRTAAVDQTVPGDEYLRRRGLWHDPGSGRFARRGWSTLKGLAARLLSGDGVRDAARDKGTTRARLRDDRFSALGLAAGDVVTVRYDDDESGRVVVTQDGGRTRSYRVPWDRLVQVDGDDDDSVRPVPEQTVDVERLAIPERVSDRQPPSLVAVRPERSTPRAAREEALRLLESVSDDPFDTSDGPDTLTEQDRTRLDVIVRAGAILLGDLRAARAEASEQFNAEYWSADAMRDRRTSAEAYVATALKDFGSIRQELVDNVVTETRRSESVPFGAPLPEGPFEIVDVDNAQTSGAVDFRDANGELWFVKPVLGDGAIPVGWALVLDRDVTIQYPTAWMARRNERNAAAKFRRRAALQAGALRRANLRLQMVETEEQHHQAQQRFGGVGEAQSALVAALQDAGPALFDGVRATVMRQSGGADQLAAIGTLDPSRPIVLAGGFRQRHQRVAVPTVTAAGERRLMHVAIHSLGSEAVAMREISVFDATEVEPTPLFDVPRGLGTVRDSRLAEAMNDWVSYHTSARTIVDRQQDSDAQAVAAWTAEALAAGGNLSVRPGTDQRQDQERAEWLSEAARLVPAALVEAVNDRVAPLTVTSGDPTQLQSFYRESEFMVSLVAQSAALHEFGHALEYRLPALNRMIWAFYQHRTEGDDLVTGDLTPGVMTRADWFFDAYAGRDYGYGTERNPERLGREVFTVGLEGTLGVRDVVGDRMIDDEHAAFVLGALLLASRPGPDGIAVRPVGFPSNRGFVAGEAAPDPDEWGALDVGGLQVVGEGERPDEPSLSNQSAILRAMENPEWTDRVDEPVRQRAGRVRGQWIETTSSRHSTPLGDGTTLIVTVDAETNRRNVRTEPTVATGRRGEGVEVRGATRSGNAYWILTDSEGQIVLSTDPRDELDLQPDETVEAFRERAKQAALEAAVRAKQNDLPSEADLESMSLSELEALFFSLRDNQTVNRNFLYLLRRHIKAKREGTTIDAIQTGPYTYMNRPVLFAEVDASHTTTTRVVAAYSDFGDDLSFPVGFVTWDRNALTLELVGVQRDARNQGIAQELIRQAMALEPRLRPKDNDARSADGDALVRSMWPDAAPASRQLSETEAESLAAGMFVQLDVSPESRLQSLPVQSIDMLEIGAPVSEPVAGATIDGIRGRDTMSTEIYTRRGDSWKQAVTKISEQISDDAMDEFAAGMAALLVAEDQRRQQRVDNAPAGDRLIRGVGQLDLSQTDLSKDSGWSPGDGTIVTTIDPSSTTVGFEKTYKAMIRREDLVPITDDRDGYTTWMAWDEKANLMRVFKVRDDLRQEDGTWKLPSSFTNFGGPVGSANGDDTLGVKRAAAALMRGAWAKSVDSVLSYLLREAALEVSGRPKRTLRKLVEAKSGDSDKLAKFDAGVAQVAFMRSLARDVVQAGYADTQRRLSELGISEVTLYRGVADFGSSTGGGFPDGRGKVTDAPLSSWTADWTVAQYFADLRKYDGISWGTPLVMARTVPAEQIMGWAGTALGSEDELEVVLLGSDKADTLVMEDYELDDLDMEQILPSRRAAVVADDGGVIVDEDWVRVVRRSRRGSVWSAIFDGGVVANFTNDTWEVTGPEPVRTDVETMLGDYLENGWPYQFGGWTDEAFAPGIDPDWMRFRLLASGATNVLGPVGALGSLPVPEPDVIVG